MDFFDVINTRKTIRKYSSDIPPIDDIKRIIDAGRLAPSATNNQNWEFIAVYNQDIKDQMVKAVVETYEELEKVLKDEALKPKLLFYKNYSKFLSEAPVIIAAVETPKVSFLATILESMDIPIEELIQMRPDSSLLSMGAAIENMSLAAHALGYGSCWMCAPIIAYKQLKEILDIPNDSKVVSLLALGKPFDDTTKSPVKKSLDDVMTIIK